MFDNRCAVGRDTEVKTNGQSVLISSSSSGAAADKMASDGQSEVNMLRAIVTTLAVIENALAEMDGRIRALGDQVSCQQTRQEWYSIAEASKQLGKAEFTVREWCRLRRINAHKRECGRGGKREWMISHDELERIRHKGLLPVKF
ncbi:MAG: helix-turn-helix domain-containing protein [Microthrixaceae bacterium]